MTQVSDVAPGPLFLLVMYVDLVKEGSTVKLLKTGPSENLSSLNIGLFLLFLCKRLFTKPATPLTRPFLFVPVLAGLENFHNILPLALLFLIYKIPHRAPLGVSCQQGMLIPPPAIF
jgi:hypothetical protein